MLRTLCLGFVLWGFSAAPCRAAERGSARSPRISAADSQASLTSTTPSPAQVPASATPAEHATANALLDEAKKLYRSGDFEQAIQEYQQVLREWPSSAEAYAGLTRVYLKKKDAERADPTVTDGRFHLRS